MAGEKKLQDSELKVMNVIWREGSPTASRIAEVLRGEVGWNVNTTYTLIKRCIEKGAVKRTEPGFVCTALILREEVQRAETDRLIDKIFDGSAEGLFASLLGRRKLSGEKIASLRRMIDDAEREETNDCVVYEPHRRGDGAAHRPGPLDAGTAAAPPGLRGALAAGGPAAAPALLAAPAGDAADG